jgi:hypothetical protein
MILNHIQNVSTLSGFQGLYQMPISQMVYFPGFQPICILLHIPVYPEFKSEHSLQG